MALVKDRTFYREVIAICIPATLQSLISMAVSMLDNVMLGTLGETAISASALSNQIFFFFMILNFGLAGGADSVNEAGELVVGGIGTAGKVAVVIGFAVLLVISVVHSRMKEEKV